MTVRSLMVVVMLLGLSGFPPTAHGGDPKGETRLSCAVGSGVEMFAGGGSRAFDPERVGLPNRFVIDFDQGLLLPAKESVVRRRSRIERVTTVENKLILQGTEEGVEGVNDGVGWSLSLVRDSGAFVITASGENVGYVVFGNCVPK